MLREVERHKTSKGETVIYQEHWGPTSIYSFPEPKESIEDCVYCATKYDKKEERGDSTGHCPNCGGTVTEQMGDGDKALIGRLNDKYWTGCLDPRKVTKES